MFRTVSRREVAEGTELYTNFVKEEFEEQGLSSDFHSLVTHRAVQSLPSIPSGYSSPETIQHGRKLRELSDKFSKLSEGVELMQKVTSMYSDPTQKDEFIGYLRGIFEDGECPENVLKLFVFSSKYLIQAFVENSHKEACVCLFLWSLEYVTSRVCRWVKEKGGWGKVIEDLMASPAFMIVAVAALAIGAFAAISYFFGDNDEGKKKRKK